MYAPAYYKLLIILVNMSAAYIFIFCRHHFDNNVAGFDQIDAVVAQPNMKISGAKRAAFWRLISA